MPDELTAPPERSAVPYTAHACWQAGCATDVIVQWRRRLTEPEFAALVALEMERRAVMLTNANPQGPPPVFGPLPAAQDCARAVHACGKHALGMELAAQVHAAHCAGPAPDLHPGCACEPEPLPDVLPDVGLITVLPAHWNTETSPS